MPNTGRVVASRQACKPRSELQAITNASTSPLAATSRGKASATLDMLLRLDAVGPLDQGPALNQRAAFECEVRQRVAQAPRHRLVAVGVHYHDAGAFRPLLARRDGA
jgi:hypothetical protein